LKDREFEQAAQKKSVVNDDFGDQDIFSVRALIHSSACPEQADVKLGVPSRACPGEDFLRVRRQAAAHDVVARWIQQGRLEFGLAFDFGVQLLILAF
jgi:hypothetical protein